MASSSYRYRIDRRANVYARFKHISLSEKILTSCFLMTMWVGYVFAIANLYFTYQDRDGRPGVSVTDVMINFHGATGQTRLGAAIKGPMEGNLKYKSDKAVILGWLDSGATEAEYKEHIAPILDRDCVGCHSPAVNPGLPNLTNFEGVSEVAKAGGAPLPLLVRISHIHLFGIGLILFFIGRIFLMCEINSTLKRIVVAIPFAALLIDIMSWFITKTVPEFAYVVVLSGGLMGMSMGLQIFVSLIQMWRPVKNYAKHLDPEIYVAKSYYAKPEDNGHAVNAEAFPEAQAQDAERFL